MSYIITAEFPYEAESYRKLIANGRVRRLSQDLEEETVTVDISSAHDTRTEDTQWLCERLVEAGILSFEIGHSY